MAAAVLTSSTHMNVIVFCTINTTRWMINKVRGTIGRGRQGLVQHDKCQGQWSTLSGVLTRVLSVECIVVKCTCTATAFLVKSTSWACETWVKSTLAESGSAQSLVSSSKVSLLFSVTASKVMSFICLAADVTPALNLSTSAACSLTTFLSTPPRPRCTVR